ncbi:MAG: hypothetical protein RR365_15370, partial [Bacteroides sp.]
EVRQRAQGENIILNQFWDIFFSGYTYFKGIAYGSGTNSPLVSDKVLGKQEGAINPTETDDVISVDTKRGVISRRRKITLSETTAVGKILSEVGIIDYNNKLVTRALLQDMNGNLISINKTNADIINIYATVFVHYNKAGYDNGKIFFDFLTPASFENSYGFAFWLLGKGCNLSGHWSCNSLFSIGFSKVHDVLNKTTTLKFNRLSAADGNNEGGVRYYSSSVNDLSIILIGPSSVIGESIGTGDGINKKFKTKFNFATISKIYLDGIPSIGYTSYNHPINTNNMAVYLQKIDEYGNILGCTTGYMPTDGNHYYYNPHFDIGISNISCDAPLITYLSNDLTVWAKVTTSAIPEKLQHYKYLNLVGHGSPVLSCASFDGYNIVFDTAPSAGTVITADYSSTCIPKDVNHVFDFSCELQFGEYTPPVV